MLNKNIRLGITTATVTTFTLIVGIFPSYAAEFRFSLETYNTNDFGLNMGELSFNESSLTGIGEETAKISDLKDVQFSYQLFDFSLGAPTGIGYYVDNSSDAITFNFKDGKLEGVNLTTSSSYSETFTFASYSSEYEISKAELIMKGNSYEERFTGYTKESGYQFDPTCDNTDPNCGFFEYINRYDNSVVQSGPIIFTTITPITSAVPEPLTILGTITALGLGVGLKRKM
jgi:hypothetical protein